jgi:signal peptidase II
LAGLLVSLDQLTKLIARGLGFETVCNFGVAFGLFPGKTILLIAVSLMVAFLVFHEKLKTEGQKIAIILVVSGGVANLFDRVRFGCVIDFINLRVWPSFNLADLMVSFGVLYLVFSALKQ